MTSMKSTKRALLTSVMALFVCFTMLLGTTFAWFTDSAASSGNKIVAGTLDVQLFEYTSDTAATEITSTSAPVFDTDIVWEPGRTQVVYFSVKNNGTLALKYKVALVVTDDADGMTEVMKYDVATSTNDPYGYVTAWVGNDNATAIKANNNQTEIENVTLEVGDEQFFAISIHMLEEAGNEYMGDSIGFDIKVLAGQVEFESDSIDNTYDKYASYPGTGYAAPIGNGTVATEIPIRNEEDTKVGSVLIPAAAIADTSKAIEANIAESNYKGNFTIAAGSESIAYEITVSNIKAGNTAPIKVEARIAAGLDPATVKLYHYDTEIVDFSYDPYTGYVSFETTGFSPFTIVFDAESEYVPPVTEGVARPTAKVTYYPDWVGADIEWGNFGGFAPTAGLEAKIDAAFIFECPDLTDAQRAAYENWLCDFYVSLDRDLGANEIFLGGQYGDYLVGFHNGDLTLEAGTELPLLGAAISGELDGITNWTYANVESFVGQFTCGVGDVDGSLTGATFTVALRLINPENTSEYYDVNVVTYTFGGNSVIDGTTVVTTGDGLQDAINNGDENITLGGDIDLSEGIVIPG